MSNESYVELNAIKETMNEQYYHFVSEMSEFDLLCETDLSLPSSRLEASLCVDCESSLLPESNFINYALLIDLEKVFDLASTSSTPTDTTISALTLLASPPL